MNPICEICTKFDKENETCISDPLGTPNSMFCPMFDKAPKAPRVKPKMTSRCNQCSKFDREANTCPLEPFEGQYNTSCPKIDIMKSDITLGTIFKTGILIIGMVIAAVLFIVFCSPDNRSMEQYSAVPTIDPWKLSQPETSYELEQAISAMVLAKYLETEFDEVGFVLMTKKSGSGYKTLVWAKNDEGLIGVMDAMDDSCQVIPKSDHDKSYIRSWHIKYVSWSEYEKICANYPSA